MAQDTQLYQAPYAKSLSGPVPAVAAGNDLTTLIDASPIAGIVSSASYSSAANVNGAATNNRTFALMNLTQGVMIAMLALIAGVNLAAGQPAQLTLSGVANGCSTTSGSNIVSGAALTAGNGFAVGQTVSGPGIPYGSTITAITSGTSITISQNATATANGNVTVTVANEPNLQVNAGDVLSFVSTHVGTGIADPGGVVIVSISGVDTHVTTTPYYELPYQNPAGSDALHLGSASI